MSLSLRPVLTPPLILLPPPDRDQILASKSEPREKIIEFISSAPCALNADDVEDFCQLAHFYSTKTPPSIYASFRHSLFGLRSALNGSCSASPSVSSTSTPEPVDPLCQPLRQSGANEDELISASLAQVLCLPVPPSDLLLSEAQRMSLPYKSLVRYFVVDCRPAEQYNAGHLKTAFHLDASLVSCHRINLDFFRRLAPSSSVHAQRSVLHPATVFKADEMASNCR